MFRSYIITALRNITRHKLYSAVNIAGLALGMTCFIMIAIWVKGELSFDRFHENRDRIFRVITTDGSDGLFTTSPWPLGPALLDRYPEIESFCRCYYTGSVVRHGDVFFDEHRFFLADSTFFNIFSFPFIAGESRTALAGMNSIVLTEEAALRYFGTANPIGRTLFMDLYQTEMTVTGVVENPPSNSHIQFDMVARVEWMGKSRLESWELTGFTYVMLHPATEHEEFDRKVKSFYRDMVDSETTLEPVLQSVTGIHLNEFGNNTMMKQVAVFSVIAVFVLLIACINYMNLSTAKSARRALEVGIRKVCGAKSRQLISQFLGESVVYSLLALVLAAVASEILFPYFNRIAGTELSLMRSDWSIDLTILIVVALVTGLLSGCYPALVLSRVHPASIIKRRSTMGGGGLRKILVICQFAISTLLVACTLIVSSQMKFIRERDLGFDRSHVIRVPANRTFLDTYKALRNEILSDPGVMALTAMASSPTEVNNFINIDCEGNAFGGPFGAGYTMADYDFENTFDMEIIDGRSFSIDHPSDETSTCIINEKAAKMLGLEHPIGSTLYFDHPQFEESKKNVEIIGVVRDFHYKSLHSPIGPFVFRMHRPWHGNIFIKLRPEGISETIRRIESIYKSFSPDYPFEYSFLDEMYDGLYRYETVIGTLFKLFALIAIFISCLGLFGLAAFTAESRTKEIGIRKVLGSSVSQIVLLLSGEFSKWVLLSNLIAIPLAYVTMRNWLNGFSYRIDIGPWPFLIAALATYAIALATVSHQALRSSLINPVEVLHYE